MRIIDLDQNTKEWLEERKKYIGGSDLPSIMQVSPWRTVFQLWEEKLCICTPDHASKAYIFWKGHRMEAIARQNRELQIGFDIPAQVIQSDQFPWARVSLDCLNVKKDYVGEIKFMGVDSWNLLKYEKEIPDHYYPQVQYQLFVTGMSELEFIGINEDKKLAITIIKPDLPYMEKMIKTCIYFWKLKEEKKAPRQVQQDFKKLSRIKAVTACKRIFIIDKKINSLMDERVSLQKVVLDGAKSTRMLFSNKIVVRTRRFDSDDLSLIEDFKGHNLDYVGRSIKDDLELIIIKNNHKHIKGASSGKSKKGKSSKKSSRKKSGAINP